MNTGWFYQGTVEGGMSIFVVCAAVILLVLALTKGVAQLFHLWYVLLKGGAANAAMSVTSGEDRQGIADDFLTKSRPIDNLYESRKAIVSTTVGAMFNQGAIVIIGSVFVLWVYATSIDYPAILIYVLSLALLGGAVLQLLVAFLRNLVFGVRDALFKDIKLPLQGLIRSWAVNETGSENLPIYFLVVSALIVLGFADAYASLAVVDPSSFAMNGVQSSPLAWVYFSISTILTVGYGDVHAQTVSAQAIALAEMVAGPLLLTWLLALYLRGGENGSQG